MHNRALHDSLAAFVQEAAWQLAEEVSGGAEIPFELDATPTRNAPLYCYRPLTGPFIAPAGRDAQPPAELPAGRAQGLAELPDLPAYLATRGRRGARARAARRRAAGVPRRGLGGRHRLRLRRPRFAAAYAELEEIAYGGCALCVVITPVEGLVIESDEVPLGDGLSLVRATTLADAPARPAATTRTRTVAVLALESRKDGRALEQAGRRLRRLQTALRLWDDAEPALGPTAQARTDGSAVDGDPARHRPPPPDRGLPARRRGGGPAARVLRPRRPPHAAVGRAGVGAAPLRARLRARQRVEALTDWLLAAKALFADVRRTATTASPSGSPRSAPSARDRPALEARVREAISLERAAMVGFVQAAAARSTRSCASSAAACGRSCATCSAATSTRRCAGSPTTYAFVEQPA